MRAQVLVVIALTGCAADPPGVSLKFDPCDHPTVAAPGASPEQLASLDEALASWRSTGAAGFSRDDAAPTVTLEFRDAADPFFGFYDETTGTVLVNLRLVDHAERTNVIAHELGHALGLLHVEAETRTSVMNPGNLTNVPNTADAAALAELWGACPPAPPEP